MTFDAFWSNILNQTKWRVWILILWIPNDCCHHKKVIISKVCVAIIICTLSKILLSRHFMIFNHYITVKFISNRLPLMFPVPPDCNSFQTDCCYGFSFPPLVGLWANIFTLFSLALIFTSTHFLYKVLPFHQ